MKAIKDYSPKIEKVGVLGYCWGGKVGLTELQPYETLLRRVQIVSLTTQSGTTFTAAAQVHPAMVDPNDAKGITVPLCMLASGDENKDAVKGFEEALTVPKYFETYPEQVHGWMAARYVCFEIRLWFQY